MLVAALSQPAAAQTTPVVTIAAGTSPVTEGTAATFTLTASSAPATSLTVGLDVSGADFVLSTDQGAKTATIPANMTTATYSVMTVGGAAETTDEPTGPVSVKVLPGSGYAPGAADSVSVTVRDDDPTTATLTTPDNMATEGDATDTASLTVTLNRGLVSGEALAVPLAFSGGVLNTDFTLALSGNPAGVAFSGTTTTLTFTGPATGATAAAATLLLTASDDVDRQHETVAATLGTLTPTSLDGGAKRAGNPIGQITITDDDFRYELSVRVAPDSVEGDGGISYREIFFDESPPRPDWFRFRVCFSGSAQRHLNFEDNKAGLALDYEIYSARKTSPNTKSKDQTNGYWYNVPAEGAPEEYTEGCTGRFAHSFQTRNRYWIGVKGDSEIEPDETITINIFIDDRLRDGKGKDIDVVISQTANVATYTILNDDFIKPDITIAADAATVPEGARTTFTVSSNPAPTSDLEVNLSVSDAAGADFVAAGDEGEQTVTIPANMGKATYRLSTTLDDADEPDGPVTVTVKPGVRYNAGSPASASVTMNDDDPTLVQLAVTDGIAREGSDTDTAEFFVSTGRALVAGETLSVPVSFSGGARNADFTLEPKSAYAGVSLAWSTTVYSTVTFAGPAASEARFVVKALADGDTEDELVGVSIPASSSAGAPRLTATNLGGGAKAAGRAAWSITLVDDDGGEDAGLVESAGRLNLVEGGEAGSYALRLRTAPVGAVTVTATSEDPAKVKVHADGGAPGASATLTFGTADWSEAQIVTVTTQEDADANNELIDIAHAVSGPGDYGGLSPAPVVAFVADDEGDTSPQPPVTPPVTPPVAPPSSTPAVSLSASPNPAAEGETITVAATLTQPLGNDVTIPLAFTSGTAEAGDYAAVASIVIEANQTSSTGPVATNADDDADDETFTVALGELPAGVQAGDPSSVELTIVELILTEEPTSAERDGAEEEIPAAFALEQNYPNPFNPKTTIRFSLAKAQRARLAVYDVLGHEVRVLTQGARPAGRYDVSFDASDLASGTYFYVLRTEDRIAVKTMALLK